MPRAAPLRPPVSRAGVAPRALAVLLGLTLATPATAARAAPRDPALEAATRRYQEGISERDAGDFVTAAESFTAALRDLPPTAREIRAAVLFDLVDARRNAFAEGEGPGQICESERLLGDYLAEVKQSLGARADKLPDTRKARKLLADVRKQLAAYKVEHPDLDCARTTVERPTPEPEPEPAPPPAPAVAPEPAPPPPDTTRPRRARALVIAGSVTTGVGGLFLGVMAGGLAIGRGAERDGDAWTQKAIKNQNAPLSADDPALQSLVRRGQMGNKLAIAGGVLATVLVATGVGLLVLGLRGKPNRPPRAALAPTGPGLTLRF